MTEAQHPAPWWFRLAGRLCPDRCRSIPEAANPDRIVLRQVALTGRFGPEGERANSVYLQQFPSGEDARYLHSHQFRWCIAIGLWGSYTEHRMNGPARERRAPYFYVLGSDVIHRVADPSPGHTSIFIGIGRDASLKKYFGSPQQAMYGRSSTVYATGDQHIAVKVRLV